MNKYPLALHQISKAYGDKPVLHDISLNVDAGQIMGLVGLNGAGKTTMIKLSLYLIRSDSGTIEWYGTPSSNAHARKNIAYLPERFRPSQHLSGLEYLQFTRRHLDAHRVCLGRKRRPL